MKTKARITFRDAFKAMHLGLGCPQMEKNKKWSVWMKPWQLRSERQWPELMHLSDPVYSVFSCLHCRWASPSVQHQNCSGYPQASDGHQTVQFHLCSIQYYKSEWKQIKYLLMWLLRKLNMKQKTKLASWKQVITGEKWNSARQELRTLRSSLGEKGKFTHLSSVFWAIYCQSAETTEGAGQRNSKEKCSDGGH